VNFQEARFFEVFTALAVVLLVFILVIFSMNLAEFFSSIGYRPSLTLEKFPSFIWTYRGLDMLAQVFTLLATALGVVALLREDEGPGVEEEPAVEVGEEG